MESLIARMDKFKRDVDQLRITQEADIKNKKSLEEKVKELTKKLAMSEEEEERYKEAVEILRQISDDSVKESYKYIEDSVNRSLERIFESERRIKINEFSLGVHPQLEVELYVEDGKKRSLKTNSGRGIAQIVSFLCLLNIIVITKARRLVVLDEALGGLSGYSRQIISDIMWNFTNIGFQFIINEHGFIPKGAKVYYLENVDGVGNVAAEFIENTGVYLTVVGETENSKDEYLGMVKRNKGKMVRKMTKKEEQESTADMI